jgi:hypothetical protein
MAASVVKGIGDASVKGPAISLSIVENHSLA